MKLVRIGLVALLACCSAFTTLQACSSDEPEATRDAGADDDESPSSSSGRVSSSGGSSSSGSSSSSSSGSTSSSSGGSSSSSGGSSSGGSLDGGLCGAPEFGQPATPFVHNPGLATTAVGGSLTPGVYDAVYAERSSDLGGSWRETLVLSQGPDDAFDQFARVRQIQTSDDGALGPVAERVGTFEVDGTTLRFHSTCGANDGEPLDAPDDSSFPYSVITDDAGMPTLHVVVTGLDITLRKRAD